MYSAWRRRCPKGHSSIANRDTGYRCRSCEATYEGDPFDAKETEFPVDSERYETRDLVSPETVLRALVDAQPEREWTRVSHLSDIGRAKDLGAKLRMLHDRGLVEKNGMGNDSDIWRPTDRGHAVAQSDGLDRDADGRMLEGCQP